MTQFLKLINEYRPSMDHPSSKDLEERYDVLHSWAAELVSQLKTVELVNDKHYVEVRAASVMDMTLDEACQLRYWAQWQNSKLWENMSLQEILNVYRVSSHWATWENWYNEEPNMAKMAWNEAVIDPKNKMHVDG